jgi:hypothetical protein
VARLTLFINGTAYNVRPISIAASVATRLYRLRKADGTAYNVAMTLDGPICDCPDFTFHRDGIDPDGCKHIKAMIAVRLLDSPKGGA